MAISRIAGQDKSAVGSGTSPTTDYPSTPTEGNLLIAIMRCNGNSIAEIVSSPSGWSTAVEAQDGSQLSMRMLYKIAGASEPTTVGWTTTNGSSWDVLLYEYSGHAASPYDINSSTVGSTNRTTESTTLGTLSQSDELVLGVIGLNGSSGGFNSDFTSVGLSQIGVTVRVNVGEKITTATTSLTISDSWVTARHAIVLAASFKAQLFNFRGLSLVGVGL